MKPPTFFDWAPSVFHGFPKQQKDTEVNNNDNFQKLGLKRGKKLGLGGEGFQEFLTALPSAHWDRRAAQSRAALLQLHARPMFFSSSVASNSMIGEEAVLHSQRWWG